jgi:hypothetical protein
MPQSRSERKALQFGPTCVVLYVVYPVLCYVQGTSRQHCNFSSTGLTSLATAPSTPPIRPSGPVPPHDCCYPRSFGSPSEMRPQPLQRSHRDAISLPAFVLLKVSNTVPVLSTAPWSASRSRGKGLLHRADKGLRLWYREMSTIRTIPATLYRVIHLKQTRINNYKSRNSLPPCGVRHEISSATRSLKLWVRILLEAWMYVWVIFDVDRGIFLV